jgi:hypothetical protein
MQKQKGARSHRKVGFMAALTLAGGLASTALLLPGTALANTGPASTTTTMSIKAPFAISGGLNGDEVDVTVSTGTGSAPAPTGSVTVSFGSISGSVTLNTGSSDTSTGAVFFDGSHAPGIPSGTYTVTAAYHPADATQFAASSTSATDTIGTVSKAPVFTVANPPLNATRGEDYDYTFQASGTPAPTYSLASGAPSWLHINSSTGEVHGDVPWWVDSFTYSVIASNSAGSATAGPFTVNVFEHHHGNADITTSLHCPAWVQNFGIGTCTLTVSNIGNASASNVFGKIVLPHQLRARTCSPSGWFWGWTGWNWGWTWSDSCSISDNTATLQIGTLGAGSSESLSVTFRAFASQHFGWWHANRVTVEGIAGTNGQWWWAQHDDSFSFASVRIWPARFWW